ncbi:MAG TPA: phage/plasmid primase, P4 family [Vicinamibacterales bacterium]|nr:phage/plasmid primase, P4 family [Vicinamibacterales bacterium]
MTLDDVLRLNTLGLSLIPLKPGQKKPDTDALPNQSWARYQSERATDAELRSWFGNGATRNVGIVTGNVVVVETDNPEAEDWCKANLPDTPMMTRSARGFHRYYRRPPAIPEIPAEIRPTEGIKIEVKRDGQMVVGPGSVHPGTPELGIPPGHVYAEVQPWPVSLDDLPVFPMDVFDDRRKRGKSSPLRDPLPTLIPHYSRNSTLFREGCRLRRLGLDQTEIRAALDAINTHRCKPPLDSKEIITIAHSCAKYEPAADTFHLSDTGNAEFFAAANGDAVRYDHGRLKWFVFTGQHWRPDSTSRVHQLALDAIRARQRAGVGKPDCLKWAAGSESRKKREDMVHLAEKIAALSVTGDDWDTNPWLLGVQNGVLDLQTGQRRDGTPADAITKVTPVPYDPNAACPRWDRFMCEVFADHLDVANYLRRVMGYALTGIITEQVFWILFGKGANGKSTLMETLMRCVFGDDYAWTMPFPSADWSNAMSEYQKASLAERRMIAASEVARSRELNEQMIKSLTGGDTINARHPYGRPFKFGPIAKFFLRVNEKPVIRDQSHGMWRRVKLVPFTQTFPIDNSLADTLAAEASGILAWAVRGCLEWQRDGLQHPEVVEAATKEYQAESDPLADFIAERCVVVATAKVAAGVLFKNYINWCDAGQRAGDDRLSQKAFGTRLKELFEAREEGRNRVMTYLGIGLRAEGPSSGDRGSEF